MPSQKPLSLLSENRRGYSHYYYNSKRPITIHEFKKTISRTGYLSMFCVVAIALVIITGHVFY